MVTDGAYTSVDSSGERDMLTATEIVLGELTSTAGYANTATAIVQALTAAGYLNN